MTGREGAATAGVAPISIAIPTYRREQMLIDSLRSLLCLVPRAAEILILDQTIGHDEATETQLRRWHEEGEVRWLRLAQPSIPGAMNRALLEAREDIVLFLDDDIVPFPDLVLAHVMAHADGQVLVAGRVLQPWHGEIRRASWAEEAFASTEAREIDAFIGCNFSLRRSDALALGGFDENFVRVAFEFEREFAHRWRARGGRILFCADAAIRHLKASTGGTRTFGEHLTTILPAHSVGAYYCLLRSGPGEGRLGEFLARPLRAVMYRHYLRRPWWIPVTLIAELTGMVWALALHWSGPRYCAPVPRQGGH
jgi:GT2 family glycosyltransferase